MALIVEDGTGKTDSNTYASAAFAETYHEDRGNTTWATSYTDDQREAALIRAADYLCSLSYRGVKAVSNQAMSFPRACLYDDDGYLLDEEEIPTKMKYAQCEAALIEAAEPGALAPQLERGGAIKRKRIDVIEIEYKDGAPSKTSFYKVQQFLKDYIRNSLTIEVVRS